MVSLVGPIIRVSHLGRGQYRLLIIKSPIPSGITSRYSPDEFGSYPNNIIIPTDILNINR